MTKRVTANTPRRRANARARSIVAKLGYAIIHEWPCVVAHKAVCSTTTCGTVRLEVKSREVTVQAIQKRLHVSRLIASAVLTEASAQMYAARDAARRAREGLIE